MGNGGWDTLLVHGGGGRVGVGVGARGGGGVGWVVECAPETGGCASCRHGCEGWDGEGGMKLNEMKVKVNDVAACSVPAVGLWPAPNSPLYTTFTTPLRRRQRITTSAVERLLTCHHLNAYF